MDIRGEVDVYTHPQFFKVSYKVQNGAERYLGIPHNRQILESKGARFRFDDRFKEIAPGIYLTGEVLRKAPFEKGDIGLVIKSEN
ncbi:MAG: hypothetical protein PHI90_08055 [Clostridia bacterium]|nr:hypothetical protein [Clostridia bacterium]